MRISYSDEQLERGARLVATVLEKAGVQRCDLAHEASLLIDAVFYERARAERAEAREKALRAAWPAADDDCRTDGILDWDERGWWVVHANDSLGPYPTRDAAIDAAAGIDRGEAK